MKIKYVKLFSDFIHLLKFLYFSTIIPHINLYVNYKNNIKLLNFTKIHLFIKRIYNN